MNEYALALELALGELLPQVAVRKAGILVVGCSTSEVLGQSIGRATNHDLGELLFRVIQKACAAWSIYPAYQCCEHLNRALVIDRSVTEHYCLTEVSVVPVPGAGGSLAGAAYKGMTDPVVVEDIQAHAGIDIGDTFIGMHLKAVAVPVRLGIKQIGAAHLTAAITRPKLIGGSRAVYQGSKSETKVAGFIPEDSDCS